MVEIASVLSSVDKSTSTGEPKPRKTQATMTFKLNDGSIPKTLEELREALTKADLSDAMVYKLIPHPQGGFPHREEIQRITIVGFDNDPNFIILIAHVDGSPNKSNTEKAGGVIDEAAGTSLSVLRTGGLTNTQPG